jgi:hypothetical protein
MMSMVTGGLGRRRVRMMVVVLRFLAPEGGGRPVPLLVALRGRVVMRARVVRNAAAVLLAPRPT